MIGYRTELRNDAGKEIVPDNVVEVMKHGWRGHRIGSNDDFKSYRNDKGG